MARSVNETGAESGPRAPPSEPWGHLFYRRRTQGRVAVLAWCCLLSLLPTAAQAAFPGENGRVAFSRAILDYETRGAFFNLEIFSVDSGGGGEARLTTNGFAPYPGDITPAYSPDGRTVAFVYGDVAPRGSAGFPPPPPTPDNQRSIYLANADGSGVGRLAYLSDASDAQPAFFPDGGRIAFASARVAGNYDLWSVELGGGDVVRLTDGVGNDGHPAVSPDGTKVAFERSGEIFAMNADGGDQRNLTNTPTVADGDPDFSPDGARIVFQSARDGNVDVYSINAAGPPGLLRLTTSPKDDTGPVFSPDGTKVAFSQEGDPYVPPAFPTRVAGQDGAALFTVNPDGSQQTRVTDPPEGELESAYIGDLDPSWGPRPTMAPPAVVQPPRPMTSPAGAPPQGGSRAGACANRRVGTARADRLTGTAGGDRLLGLGGSDEVLGLAGGDCLSGGAGKDRLFGGSGDDALVGGTGADVLDGGAGRDRLSGGSGDDEIKARDRRRDLVGCGSGRDVVVADLVDRVAGDCERVRLRR